MPSIRNRRRSPLRRLGLVMLASAQTLDEELAGVLTLQLAKRHEGQTRSNRYGPRGPYGRPKCEELIDLILEHYAERDAKGWLRMTRDAFWELHQIIAGDAVFQSTGQRPQRPVKYQLAVFLIRMGDLTGLKSANVAGIAEGTFYLYARRVMKAIRKRRDQHIAFPLGDRAEYIKSCFEDLGFPGCKGIMDATLIPLKTKPRKHWRAYWCRKKFYAVVVQACCDHRGIFTSYSHGWPGSVQDSAIWAESDLWKRRHYWFAADEYILVDKGYPLTKYTIRPFADYDLTNDPEITIARQAWNVRLSSVRIKVEHTFGLLKGRFPALRNIPGYIMVEIYKLIECMMVIHNIVLALGDDPETIEGYNGVEDEQVREALLERRAPVAENHWPQEVLDAHGATMDADELYRAGVARRKYLFDLFNNVDDILEDLN